MANPQIAPYGSWKSPITTDLILSKFTGLGLIALDGSDTYWLELRPAEGGRSTIMRRAGDGVVTEMTPAPFHVRTRVHEYGGGDYSVDHGTIYASGFLDQRLYRITPSEKPVAITPEANMRYADPCIDRRHGRLICVREDHTPTDREAINTLVSVALDGSGPPQILVSGNDFYSTPRLSPDGSQLAWLTWNHPNMPWDGTELWVATVNADGQLEDAQQVAGGSRESIFQPQWSPSGVLHFISDRTGWWNIYRLRKGESEPLCEKAAEFGTPQWLFNMSTYGFASPERIICSYTESGVNHLGSLDTVTGEMTHPQTPYTSIGNVRVSPERVVFLGASPTSPVVIAQIDLATSQITVLKSSGEIAVDPSYFSLPQAIEFPTEHGLMAYAFYYPPHNPDYQAPGDSLPPLIVESHGGPTSGASAVLNLSRQFWTSRGFAVLDVDYGGSSGYGRAYRERLNGQWGIVDVDDCVNGATYLAERGLADSKRLLIRGGSAGGYTTLCALTFTDTFAAGASHFGVSDLTIFATDTHKFESRYLFSLVGPYPERKELFYQRSAINYLDQLSSPVIFFQGLDDMVVPPNQAELMVEALKAKGVPVAYLAFEGEGHGFRRAENIKRTLEAELYFYSRIFGFELADAVEPIVIENL